MSWEVWAMTLITSLFNKGIYKNTFYRFRWGSFLYFVILFFSLPFALLVQGSESLNNNYRLSHFLGELLFKSDLMIFPILFALAVPTIVSALVFHNVHSGKQGIFIHGLPVTRKAGYISNLLASFTLMALPVILNGVILLIMSLTSYGVLFTPMCVLKWMVIILGILFAMFSVATFTAFLTGNAAANIVINAFIHAIPFVVALALYGVGYEFLYGFTTGESFIGKTIIEWTPIYYIFAELDANAVIYSQHVFFANIKTWVFLGGALVLYVLTYFVYKFRKIEACGDVAAFKWFRGVIKYVVVTTSAVLVLCLLRGMEISWAVTSLVAFVICAIVYFACEMLLAKTLKVFKSYKGFVAFALVISAFISFFAFTNVFGYETRIPEVEETESATIRKSNIKDTYKFTNEEDILTIMGIHKNFVTDIEKREKITEEENLYYRLWVSYNLKNGKTLVREYCLGEEEYEAVMNKMYESKEYKYSETEIDNINVENVKGFSLDCSSSFFHYGEYVTVGADEIFIALKKDIDELNFKEIEEDTSLGFSFHLSQNKIENDISKVFKEMGVGKYTSHTSSSEDITEFFNIMVNGNFKHTIEALKKHGYYDKMLLNAKNGFVICKIPVLKDGTDNIIEYKETKGSDYNFYVSMEDCVLISEEDSVKLVEEMFVTDYNFYHKTGEIYMVYYISEEGMDKMQLTSQVCAFEKSELPEYLKKYVD